MGMIHTTAILNKALNRVILSEAEILHLLQLSDSVLRQQLFATARLQRQRYFGNKVFMYGFVYFSTYCRNNCVFCYYRKTNSEPARYRKSIGEIVEIASSLAESGVHLIDLTMGEDPKFLANGPVGYRELINIVKEVKKATNLPIMISPGLVPKDVLQELKVAGADWYACYQETHSRNLFHSLRLQQSYDERWSAKVFAKTIGLLVEEGLLVGVGNSDRDTVHSLLEMKKLGAEQVRTMTFVPQKGTPLYGSKTNENVQEINIIAVMRLLFPDRLIPASLDVEGVAGLKERLNAGANVVTSIIPPESGLMGVSQSTLDISEGYRTVKGVMPILKECSLMPATSEEYKSWLNERLGADARGAALCE
ncbi:MAG: methylornithine synthase PylB [Pelosinus sp.]|nr:methylornithine synthase PylB [Pelosinus sp.]